MPSSHFPSTRVSDQRHNETEEMKSLLIFVPKDFRREQAGYMFGKVVYDQGNDTKKFYVVGLRREGLGGAIESSNGLVGYYRGTADERDALDAPYPDWIDIYSCPTECRNSFEYCINGITVNGLDCLSSSHHTVLIIYDRTALLRAELLADKTPGDHFDELKGVLREKPIEEEIRGRTKLGSVVETLLVCHALLLLYPLRFLCKITNALQPILKYSALGLHLDGGLRNIKWMLSSVVRNKGFTLKTGNYAFAVILDVLLGVLLLRFLLHATGNVPPSQILLENAEKVVTSLKGLVNWLMGAPAGLKLNYSFNRMLGKFFLYHIQLWWTFLVFMKPVMDFAFEVLLLFGRLGVSFQISIAADLLALVSFHSYCIYVYAARLFNIQIRGLTALFRLFLGKKKNPLRARVDSCQYQPDQLFVGTLLFTILLFLIPTTWVYYSVFTALRLALIGLGGFLTRLRFYLQVMPVYTFFNWILRSPIISSSVNIRLHARRKPGPTTLIATTVSSTWGRTWKHCIPDTIACHPSIEWATIVNNAIWGQLLYPL